jgi:hypothetical protein
MTHLEKLAELRQDMIRQILDHMKSNDLTLIRFDQMFSCLLPEENTIDDSSHIQTCIAKRMWDNGEIEGVIDHNCEWSEWGLEDLDSVEIAHILDTLEAGKYKKLNPDSYDFADDMESEDYDSYLDEQ